MSASADGPENTGVVRDEKGRFIKGVSGNPAGPPKGYKREKFNRWAETRLMGWLKNAEVMAEEDAAMLRFLIEQYIGRPDVKVESDVTHHQPETVVIDTPRPNLKAV